jgi:hypothetical protein
VYRPVFLFTPTSLKTRIDRWRSARNKSTSCMAEHPNTQIPKHPNTHTPKHHHFTTTTRHEILVTNQLCESHNVIIAMTSSVENAAWTSSTNLLAFSLPSVTKDRVESSLSEPMSESKYRMNESAVSEYEGFSNERVEAASEFNLDLPIGSDANAWANGSEVDSSSLTSMHVFC